ncbi:hypothetical protein [Ruegeria sp. HKCCSP346]|uniref:hypothetical protein n=1 Tax=Ruegeria sp. HKCCSP346 TaxID=2794830 RepID=UPI001AE44B94|nr:hypothetical protein [Ruegeria sp. HKCCSP346]
MMIGQFRTIVLAAVFVAGGTSVLAAPKDGTYSLTVPSKNPFPVSVTITGGNIAGITSSTLQNINGAGVSGNSKKQSISFNFDSANCGGGNTGTMTFDLRKNVVFKKWKGTCRSKRFDISKSVTAAPD